MLRGLIAFCAVLAICASAGATTIAKVNTGKVFADMQETKDLKRKMEDEQKNFNQQLTEKRNRIEDLRRRLNLLNPTTPDYQNLRRQVLEETVNFEVWSRMQQADVIRNFKTQMRMLFDKIEQAVGQVAQKQNIDMVISEVRPELPEDLEQINPDQLRVLLQTRNLLYAAPATDLTGQVIDLLDQQYRQANGGN